MAYEYITDVGTTALWIAFAFLLFSTLVFLFLSYVRNVRPEARFTYLTTTTINGIAALAYLTMALGNTEYSNPNGERGFLWIRYADWAITVPLLVIDLAVLAGAHWVDIFFTVFAAIAMIAAGFAGAVSTGYNATWPLFAFGFACYFVIVAKLLFSFRKSAYRHHIEIGKLYDVLAFGSAIVWAIYGIVWGCAEGGYKMTPDQEVIVYAVLDITAKCVFGFVLLFSREAIARYGTFLGGINTGITYDFPIPPTVTLSSANNYAVPAGKAVVYGEHRDLSAGQVRAASGAASEHAPLVVGVEYSAKHAP